MEKPKRLGTTDFFMLLAVVFWAINFSIVKIALREFTPLAFNGIRLVFASIVLLLVLYLRGEGFSLERKYIARLFILGIVGNTAFQILFIHGIDRTSASNTSLIMALSPAFIAMLSSAVKHEKLNFASWTGIGISFAGLYLVITGQWGALRFSWSSINGDVMIFTGNVLWAIYTVFSKPILEKVTPLKWTALTMAAGAVFFLPFSIEDIRNLPSSEISLKAWASLLYSGLFALVICYVIWYVSVKKIGNSRTAIYSSMVPVITVIFAYFALGERLSAAQAAGAAVILSGVYLTRSGKWFFMRPS